MITQEDKKDTTKKRPWRVLSNEEVQQIRRWAEQGWSQVNIAQVYGITQPHVSRLVGKKRREKV